MSVLSDLLYVIVECGLLGTSVNERRQLCVLVWRSCRPPQTTP